MPFLTGFAKRKELRYGTVFPGANLSDFPKLFVISGDTDIAAELTGGGGIAVTLPDGTTEIPFGLYPSTAPASGDILMRVKLDPLTAATTGDVMAYLYYDAGETTVEDKAGVVSNDYVLFMPLEEDPSGSAPQMYDWVSESNVGTSAGSMTSGDLVAARVGYGLDFDGSNDAVSVPDLTAADYTVELWVRYDGGAPGGSQSLMAWDNYADTPRDAIILKAVASNAYRVEAFANNSGFDVSDVSGTTADLNHVAIRRSGTTVQGYVNAASAGTAVTVGAGSRTFANGTLGGHYFLGGVNERAVCVIDEFRVSSAARSADWIEYAYEDDLNNSDTFTLGAEETDGGVNPLLFFAADMRGGTAVMTGGMRG